MASVATTDLFEARPSQEPPPFSIIEYRGLGHRLLDELKRAARELAADPAGFIRGLLSSEDKDAKRRQLIYVGLAVGLLLNGTMLIIAAVTGWHRILAPVSQPDLRVVMRVDRPVQSINSPETSNVERAPGQRDGGGGGGGQQNPEPPSKGRLPQFLPTPQIVEPNPSNIPDPTLAVAPTLRGIESPPPPPGQVGDPAGKGAEFSGGPGSGGGVGDKHGTGIGSGTDSGGGPGSRGNRGGGTAGFPGARGSDFAEVDYKDLSSFPTYTPFRWLRRERPVTTPEAQENKIIGIVFLRATFNADGTITDIEVVMPVQHMTESAVEATRRSKFRPATINGRPITLRRVPIQVAVHY